MTPRKKLGVIDKIIIRGMLLEGKSQHQIAREMGKGVNVINRYARYPELYGDPKLPEDYLDGVKDKRRIPKDLREKKKKEKKTPACSKVPTSVSSLISVSPLPVFPAPCLATLFAPQSAGKELEGYTQSDHQIGTQNLPEPSDLKLLRQAIWKFGWTVPREWSEESSSLGVGSYQSSGVSSPFLEEIETHEMAQNEHGNVDIPEDVAKIINAFFNIESGGFG